MSNLHGGKTLGKDVHFSGKKIILQTLFRIGQVVSATPSFSHSSSENSRFLSGHRGISIFHLPLDCSPFPSIASFPNSPPTSYDLLPRIFFSFLHPSCVAT